VVLLNLSAEIRESTMCGLRVCRGFYLLLPRGTTETEYATFDCAKKFWDLGKEKRESMIDDDNDLMNMVVYLLIHDGVGGLIQM